MAPRNRKKNRALQQERMVLGDLMNELGTADEFLAQALLKSTLKALRKSLDRPHSLLFRDHLPSYLQDIYSEAWKPILVTREIKPRKDDFLMDIEMEVKERIPKRTNARDLVKGTLKYLASFVNVPDSRKIREGLPEEMKVLWPAW